MRYRPGFNCPLAGISVNIAKYMDITQVLQTHYQKMQTNFHLVNAKEGHQLQSLSESPYAIQNIISDCPSADNVTNESGSYESMNICQKQQDQSIASLHKMNLYSDYLYLPVTIANTCI